MTRAPVRGALCLITVGACCLALAAPAGAHQSVAIEGGTLVVTGQSVNDLATVTYEPGADELLIGHDVTGSIPEQCYRDAVKPIQIVHCPRAGITEIRFDLGAGTDTARVTGLPVEILVTVSLGEGNDSFLGGEETDDVDLGSGNDEASTGGGDDAVRARSGSDQASLGSGADLARMGSGSDQANLGSGTDEAWLGSGSDKANLGAGADDAWLGSGSDKANGGGGPDDILGGKDADKIKGGAGNDSCYGGPGPEKLGSC